ncbi:MAG: hypothetical protein KJZ57_09695, partial [Anaerolineales bacterium]|nr:hypothetical protein [Anaerolineales bacterium]
LVDASFVEAFYNQETGKMSFAHIRNEMRVFAADNRGGWHWHPIDDVARHVSSDHEITFEEFFREVGKRVE